MRVENATSANSAVIGPAARTELPSPRLARQFVVCLSCLALFSSSAAMADGPSRSGNEAQRPQLLPTQSKLDADLLIEQLVNKNLPPKLVGAKDELKPIFDRGYKWSEDERIAAATQVLINFADEALPALLKHFDDKRFSMTYYSSADTTAANFDVGRVCHEIVAESLSRAFCEYVPEGDETVYKLRTADAGASHDLRTWCIERRDKPFYELQIEQCQLAVRRIEELKTDSVDDKDKRKSIASIENQIEIMRRRRTTIQAVRFGRYFGERAYDSVWAAEIRNGAK